MWNLKRRDSSTGPYSKSLHIIRLADLDMYMVGILMYKFNTGKLTVLLKNYFVSNEYVCPSLFWTTRALLDGLADSFPFFGSLIYLWYLFDLSLLYLWFLYDLSFANLQFVWCSCDVSLTSRWFSVTSSCFLSNFRFISLLCLLQFSLISLWCFFDVLWFLFDLS